MEAENEYAEAIEKESREIHTTNDFKATSVTLWLHHCTRDYSTRIIAST